MVELTYRNDRNPDMNPDELLTNEAAALMLKVSPITLALWRRSGKGPDVVRIGARVWYHPADIARWLDAQRQAPGRDEFKKPNSVKKAAK